MKKHIPAKLSDAFSAHRIDAEYFQPVYEEILRIVSRKYNLIPLNKIFDFRRGVFIPPDFYIEQKTSRPYIRIKELSGKLGIDESKIIFVSDGYLNDEINQLYENDLVIAIIGDTIGKTNRIPKELAGGFCSNNTGRLRIKLEFKGKVLSEYAEILFQSVVIQSQIEKKKAQTGQPKINDSEIRSIKIPLPPLSTQQKIASLVQQSHEARRKAKELLEIAKRAVEIAIEENEEKAQEYIQKEVKS
jgi:type I restriction enzyme S subunit